MDAPQDWSIPDRLRTMAKRAKAVLVPRPPFPLNIMIELSNACNHACVFCANSKMTRRRRQIQPELVMSILSQARDLGAHEVGFYTTGDPFISAELTRYVGKAKDLGYKYIYISTNGALATPERSKAVIDAGLDSIKFSINAGTRETYRAIHGRDDWDKVLANLCFIAEYRKSLNRDLKLAITYVVVKQNRHECEAFRETFGQLVDDIYFSPGDNQQGYMFENRETVVVEPAAGSLSAPCHLLFSRAHITCEGYLTLCCVDYQNYLAVADLNLITLLEGWEHPRFVALRERHLAKNLEGTLCWNCLHQHDGPVEPLVRDLAVPFDFGKAARVNQEKQQRRLH